MTDDRFCARTGLGAGIQQRNRSRLGGRRESVMKRKVRAFLPQATALESRSMLSVTATTAPKAAEVSILSERSGTTAPVAITNTIRGSYFAPEDNRAADVPLHVSLDGTGRVRGIGRARLSGSLDLGGFGLAGQPDITGTL